MRLALLLLAALAPRIGAQQSSANDSLATAIASWVALDAPPGAEELATDVIRRAMPEWKRDALGNLILHRGSGSPRRVIACALDFPGYVVSQITDAGYLRLHRAGNAGLHPLGDQFMEGQRIKVLTRRGPIPGVTAIANGHFARQHRGDTTVVTVDELWVDVGARTRAEAEQLGVALIDPVQREWPVWTYAGYVAGPGAGLRAGCAAVAAAARLTPTGAGETVFILSTRHTFAWAGLSAALTGLGRVDRVVVVDAGRAARGPALTRDVQRPAWVPPSTGVATVTMIVPPVRFAGSLTESIAVADVSEIVTHLITEAGMPAGTNAPPVPRLVVPGTPIAPARRDSLREVDRVLRSIVDLPGVPGHEWRVRDAIRAALPDWARSSAVVDSAGNLIVSAGPDRDTAVFIAHMDEVSFEITGIARDGTVSLARRGGVVPSAWEGQPAMLHFDPPTPGGTSAPPSLRGVFIPRDSGRVKSTPTSTAWFGLDSAGLVAAGVRPGLGVTAWKAATPIGAVRFTGRSLDDRAGSTALLVAVRQLDPARLTRKTLFVWSVREEGGLQGARAVAERLGSTVRRVHAIDTFVSSDTPLERPTFAYAPLGSGAVLRALDDGEIVSRGDRDRITALAKREGIPLQIGTTHGSTDGTTFPPFGAAFIAISWPGRYSHTPAEVLDLRDLHALTRLIGVLATSP